MKVDWRVFLSAFSLIFLAELGDKTQLAAITMTARTGRPLSVFLGASIALGVVTLIGVLFGEAITRVIPVQVLQLIAALGFIVLGVVMLVTQLR